MSAQSTRDLFQEDRCWLEKQPGMNPWQEGCAMLAQQLQSWAHEYGQTLGIASPSQKSDHLFERLWSCWRHHWRQALELAPDISIHGQEVALRIRDAEGYCRGKQLGGDPLRDMILAEAVLACDAAATQRFEAEYKKYCLAIGRQTNARVADDPDDWWYRLFDRLAGYSDPPGKLTKFTGRCGLRNWLARVAMNFAHDYPPRPTTGQDSPIEEVATPGIEQTPEVDECVELLAQLVRRALENLASDDRLVLYLVHVDQLPGKEVAKVFGIDAGNVSRRKEKAADRLHTAMQEQAQAASQQRGYRDCLELLTQQSNCQHFGQLLWVELKRVGPAPENLGEVRP